MSITHACDPFCNQLFTTYVDVRKGWLTGEAIDVFTRIVIGKANTFHASANMFAHFSVQTLPLFLMGSLKNNRKQRSGIIKEKSIHEYRVIFCPINVNDNHWLLVVAYPRMRTFHLYDSLNEKRPEYVANVKKMFECFDFKVHDWLSEVLQSMEQPDDSSCGVFVCMHIASLCFGLTTDDWPSIQQCRLIITQTLATGKFEISKSPKV
jgi:Ulp1 family protease